MFSVGGSPFAHILWMLDSPFTGALGCFAAVGSGIFAILFKDLLTMRSRIPVVVLTFLLWVVGPPFAHVLSLLRLLLFSCQLMTPPGGVLIWVLPLSCMAVVLIWAALDKSLLFDRVYVTPARFAENS